MSNCIQKVRCPDCGSRQGLQVFAREDGGVDGFCFACPNGGSYKRHPYGDEKQLDDIPKSERLGLSPEEVQEKLDEISKLGCMNLVDRKLRKDALEYYGIKIGLSEQDGKTPAFHHYPYTLDSVLKSYKTRLIEGKRIWSVGDQKDVDLFGWEQAITSGSNRLIIVEGELDAPAMKMIIDRYQKDEYKDFAPAVCSLPHGAAAAHRDISRLASKIRKHFDKVDFCFDNDDAGKSATEECLKVFPEARVINLPEKDANDCILNGRSKAAFKAIMFKASKPKNTRLIAGHEVHEAAKAPAEFGLSFPWRGLTDITRGIRFGETYYIASGEKMGCHWPM